MSVLASDNFDRANNTDLGSSWDVQTGEARHGIVSNTAQPSDIGNDCSENNNSVSWPDDQYSKGKLSMVGGSDGNGAGPGVAVRMSASARTYYRAVANKASSNNIEVAKMVAGTYTSLAQRTQAWTDEDVLELRVIGTTLRVFYNGTQLGGDITDSSIASGRAGIAYSSGSMTSASINDWEGGDFDAGATERHQTRHIMAHGGFF